MAGNLLMSISQDEKERAVFRSRRMYQTDMQSNLATVEDRGKKEMALAIAKNLLKLNLPFDQIVFATSLDLDEVASLRTKV